MRRKFFGIPETRVPGTPALLFFMAAVLSAGSCKFLSDYYSMGPLRIDSVTLPTDLTNRLEIEFSQTMKRERTEEAVLLLGPAGMIPGSFQWPDLSTLRFTTEYKLMKIEHTLIITREAEDIFGNSLRNDYRKSFIPTSEACPFELSEPESGEVISLAGAMEPLRFIFTSPVDTDSLLRSFSMDPPVPGIWNYHDENTILFFNPAEPFQPDTHYTVRFSSFLQSGEGVFLGQEEMLRFRREDPPPVTVERVEVIRNGLDLTPGLTAEEIEKDDTFSIHFSRTLTTREADQVISISPPVPFSLQWDSDMQTAVFSPGIFFQWNQEYSININGEIFRFLCTGKGSIPVIFEELYYHGEEQGEDFVQLRLNDFLVLTDCDPAHFIFYLSHSPLSEIPLLSFLENHTIRTTNSSAGMIFYSAEETSVGIPRPADTGETVFRVSARIVSNSRPGLLIVTIGTGLKDSLENRPAELQEIHINIEG